MSIDFTFYTRIKLSEVSEKTSLRIVNNDNGTFIQDNEGNVASVIKGSFKRVDSEEPDDDTFEIVVYGSNNPTKIINELVENFNLRFLTDNDEEYLYHNMVDNIDEYIDKCMLKYKF